MLYSFIKYSWILLIFVLTMELLSKFFIDIKRLLYLNIMLSIYVYIEIDYNIFINSIK